MLTKVISGGQTGADEGGLRAARLSGLMTGGWAPKGFKTERGNQEWLGRVYGLREHPSSDYWPRTKENAQRADGTIMFCNDFKSRGSKQTYKALWEKQLPFFNVAVPASLDYQAAADWITEKKIETLNVAGNRESVFRGMTKFVTEFLVKTFALLTVSKKFPLYIIVYDDEHSQPPLIRELVGPFDSIVKLMSWQRSNAESSAWQVVEGIEPTGEWSCHKKIQI